MKLVVDNSATVNRPLRPGSRVKIKVYHDTVDYLYGRVVWTDGREIRVHWENGGKQIVPVSAVERA